MADRGSARLSAGRLAAEKKGGFSRCNADPERIFFVTTVTARRIALFRNQRPANSLLEVLLSCRERRIMELYQFVLMPDHMHLLLAPDMSISLERVMQFIKGGFSYRYRKETGSKIDIWERSFTNHRVRDWEDYENHRFYIHQNPVRSGLCRLPKTIHIRPRAARSC